MAIPVDLSGQGVTITDRLRDHTSRRLEFALGRFADHIERVQVHLDQHASGVDKECRVHVRLRGGMPSIHVTQTASREFAAVDRAADRLRQTVGRKLARRVTPPRGNVAVPG